MRAAVLQAPRRLAVVELPDPEPGPGEVLLRVAFSGVCGTDRHIYNGDYRVEHPLTPGHEYSGEVVACGDGVTSLVVGDRVTVDPNVVDDECYFCRRGVDHLCSGLSPLGVARPGGFAELSAVPARYAYRVPDAVSLLEASQVEPLACCVHGIDQAEIVAGDTVAVTGAGPIGCLLIQLARMQGAARIVAIEPNAARRDHALAAGADVACGLEDAQEALRTASPVGPDVLIEASGSPHAAWLAFDQVRRGGTILLFGVYPETARISVSPFRVNEDELRVVGSLNNPSTHQRAIDLIATGRVDVRSIITDELSLELLDGAMDPAVYPDAGKIVIRPAA